MNKINNELNNVYSKINDEIKEITRKIDEINIFGTSYKNSYKETVSYEKRCSESCRILSKHINCVPIIIDFVNIETSNNKNKFLVPNDLTISQFMYSIRKSLKINHYESIFIFFDNILVPTSKTVGEVYENYLNKHNTGDKFLYATITKENTFGNHFLQLE